MAAQTPLPTNELYCKYPMRYQTLPSELKKRYSYICELKSSYTTDWKEQGAKWGENLTNIPYNFIANMFTPEGLEMLSVFMDINLTSKTSLNFILRSIAKGVGPEVMEAANALALERGALYVNNTILTTVLTSAVEEGTVAAMALTITTTVSAALSGIEVIVIIVQILGILIDAWDPEGYANEFNADAMTAVNDSFNSEFITRFLETVTIGKDKYGRPIHLASWPVEYHLDAMLASEDPRPRKEQNLKLFEYIVEYLDSIVYNSDGQRILHADPHDTSELIHPRVFPKMSSQLMQMLSGHNTLVARWTKTHWIIVLVGIGILLFLLLRKGSSRSSSRSSRR